MKRALLGAAATVAIGYLFVSWRLGFAIEKQVNEPLEQLRGSAPYLRIVTNAFRRGWFVSEQDLSIELFGNLASAPAATTPFSTPIQIGIHNVIWHGPICGLTCIGLAHVRTQISFGPPLQGYLTSAFGSAEPLHIESSMGFGGGGFATLSSPAIKDVILANGARVAWGGLELKSEFAPGYDSYSVQGSMPKIVYASADGNQAEFDDIDLDAHSKRVLRTLFAGQSSVAIARMSFSAAKAGAATLNNIRGSYDSAVDNGFVNMANKMSVAALTVASLHFSGAHFDFSLKHLQADSLEQLSTAMRNVNQDISRPPEARGANLLAAIKKPGIVLLSHSPQLALDRLSIATGGGEAALAGTVALNGVAESDFEPGADPKAMIQKLDADLDMSIDDALLSGLPNGANLKARLQSFVDQGLATHLNGKFHTKIGFHQGMTTFDGKSLPLPAPPAQPAPPATPRR